MSLSLLPGVLMILTQSLGRTLLIVYDIQIMRLDKILVPLNCSQVFIRCSETVAGTCYKKKRLTFKGYFENCG